MPHASRKSTSSRAHAVTTAWVPRRSQHQPYCTGLMTPNVSDRKTVCEHPPPTLLRFPSARVWTPLSTSRAPFCCCASLFHATATESTGRSQSSSLTPKKRSRRRSKALLNCTQHRGAQGGARSVRLTALLRERAHRVGGRAHRGKNIFGPVILRRRQYHDRSRRSGDSNLRLHPTSFRPPIRGPGGPLRLIVDEFDSGQQTQVILFFLHSPLGPRFATFSSSTQRRQRAKCCMLALQRDRTEAGEDRARTDQDRIRERAAEPSSPGHHPWPALFPSVAELVLCNRGGMESTSRCPLSAVLRKSGLCVFSAATFAGA